MGFRPPKKQPQFADLKGILAQTKQTENPLYQTVQVLIERLGQFQSVTLERISDLEKEVEELHDEIEEIPTEELEAGYWAPLTDGNIDETDLIFAEGECIMVFIPVI